jgi:hypothetical protein
VHVQTEVKSDDTKDSVYEELVCISSIPKEAHKNFVRRFQCTSREGRYFQFNSHK